jgi:hypothetical protein
MGSAISLPLDALVFNGMLWDDLYLYGSKYISFPVFFVRPVLPGS